MADIRERRGYAVGDARRARILAAATGEFAAHGYRAASLSRIAERAGLSQAGLLHHFRTKETLLIAVLELRDAQHAARFVRPDGSTLAGREMLEELCSLIDRNAETPDLVRLLAVMTAEAVAPGHPAHGWALNRYRQLRQYTIEALTTGVANGEFDPGLDAEAQTDRLIALIDGLQLQWLLDPSRMDLAGVFRGYVADLLAVRG
ncbi:TetR/AcrR family transcriptional regulator [Actinocorallia longicatena]|uniref:TetR/AcrR family transcriptional regulator n=1 Tax=Actinocorallia longicatena TaxID=111803 RepID=UPI0031D51080